MCKIIVAKVHACIHRVEEKQKEWISIERVVISVSNSTETTREDIALLFLLSVL